MKSTKFAHEPAPPCLFMVIPWLFGSCSFIGSLTQQQERRADMSMLGCSSPETICCTHIIKYDQHIEAYCWVKLGWVCVLIFLVTEEFTKEVESKCFGYGFLRLIKAIPFYIYMVYGTSKKNPCFPGYPRLAMFFSNLRKPPSPTWPLGMVNWWDPTGNEK